MIGLRKVIDKVLTYKFWEEALQRSVRTFAQTTISLIGISSFSVWSLDWKNVVGVGLGSAFVSLLMSLDRSTNTTVVEKEIPVPVIEVAAPAAPAPFVMPTVGCGDSLR
jgi:hypothetical protein